MAKKKINEILSFVDAKLVGPFNKKDVKNFSRISTFYTVTKSDLE